MGGESRRRLSAGTGAVEPLRQDLWGIDTRHWRLNLQPGWTLIANLEGDNSREGMWCCLCTSKSYCNATEPSIQATTKGMPCGIFCILLFPKPSIFMVNTALRSFSLPFYTFTKTSNILHFSLKLSGILYLICPHIFCSHSTLIVQERYKLLSITCFFSRCSYLPLSWPC